MLCVSCLYVLYICQISRQSVQKWLSYRPKVSKMSKGKISKLVFLTKVHIQHRKMKIAPLNSPTKSATIGSFFVAKITTLKFSPFSPRSLVLMSWTLSWPWPHIWPFLRNFKHSSEPSRYELSIAACRVFLRPFVSKLAGGVIFTLQRCGLGWRP